MDSPLIDDKELARITGTSVSMWQKRRVTGNTPPFIKIGKVCRYRLSDVEDWLRTRERKNTSQEAA